VGVSVY